jgi:hypothetical protein
MILKALDQRDKNLRSYFHYRPNNDLNLHRYALSLHKGPCEEFNLHNRALAPQVELAGDDNRLDLAYK